MAYYNPSGNILNRYSENIPPIGSKHKSDRIEIVKVADANPITEHFAEIFFLTFLEVLNIYRYEHRVPPLEMSEELNEKAQQWAQVKLKFQLNR